MAEYSSDFLNAFFGGLASAEKEKQQGFENQRKMTADMLAQHKFQLEQDQEARMKQFQQAQMSNMDADNKRADQTEKDRQTDRQSTLLDKMFQGNPGAQIINTPQDTSQQLQMPTGQGPIGGATPQGMPPGAQSPPQPPPSLAQQLPIRTTPLQQDVNMQVPAAAQIPEHYNVAPPGVLPDIPQLAGKTAIIPDQFAQAEMKQDATQEGWPTWNAALANRFPDLGIQPGDKYDPKLQEHILTAIAANKDSNLHFTTEIDDKGTGHIVGIDEKTGEKKSQVDIPGMGKTKTQTTGEDDAAGAVYGEGLIKNPDMKIPDKYSLPTTKYLQSKGLPGTPRPMAAGEVRPVNSAKSSMAIINQLDEYLQDPLINKNLGPIMGNAQDLSQKLGKDFVNRNPGAIAKMQEFRTLVKGNLLNELNVINPRAAASLLSFIQQMAPNERMEPAMFEGAMRGMYRIAYNRVGQAKNQQWGGKAPEGSMDEWKKPSIDAITTENPSWRKQGDNNFIPTGDSRVVKVGDKRINVYHDSGDDKFYQLMTLPK